MTQTELDAYILKTGGFYVATHDGKRYLDDIVGVALFERLGAQVRRVDRAERAALSHKYLLFATGGGKYDHHQGTKEYRPTGIPYSSIGLLFREFGALFVETYLDKETHAHFGEVVARFDSEIIQCLDAHVNGYPVGIYEYRWVVPAIAIVDKVDSEETHEYVLGLLEGCLREISDRIETEMHIKEAIEAGGGGLMILDPGCSFIQHLRRYNISAAGINDPMHIVVHPNETNWTLRCVPDPLNDNVYRVSLPVEWLTTPPEGCHNDKLTFVHKDLWMATFETKTDALHAARYVLSSHPYSKARQKMAVL